MPVSCKDINGVDISVGDRVKLEEAVERTSGEIIPVGTLFTVRYLFIDGTVEVLWDRKDCVVPAKCVSKVS